MLSSSEIWFWENRNFIENGKIKVPCVHFILGAQVSPWHANAFAVLLGQFRFAQPL